MSSSIDQEVLQIFFEEGRQALDDLESGLLRLESGGLSGEDLKNHLDALFRHAHNFKGASAAVGFEQLTQLAHAIEDVLAHFKMGSLLPSHSRCSSLLNSIDGLRRLLGGLMDSPGHRAPIESYLDELKNCAQNQESPAQSRPQSPTESAVSTPKSQNGKAASGNEPSQKAPEEKSIRVNTIKLDSLLNLIGELVVNQSMMISHRVNATTGSDHAIQTLAYIEKIVLELQSLAMTLRMVPIKPLFQKMGRIVRDVSMQLGKDVQFVTDGDHVELDKIVLERVTDPLTHLIRNAIDHGLEGPDARIEKGKPKSGRVQLSAFQRDDKILITVRDDGKGLDAEVLKNKAIEKGLISREQAEVLTEESAWNLIFLPGFSTKETISDISGRGVGMDVVSKSVAELKGDIRVRSKKGKGTHFEISLPLSLSIIPGMVVAVDRENYVIPVSQLVEIIELQKFNVQTSTKKGRMINLRGDVIPVHSLSSLLSRREGNGGKSRPANEAQYKPAIVGTKQGRKFACEVDSIIGQQQIVIKKLGSEIQTIPGILGGAVLSDGEPSMILDLPRLPGLTNLASPADSQLSKTTSNETKEEQPNGIENAA